MQNPITALIEKLGLERQEMERVTYLSRQKFSIMEDGGFDTLPRTLTDLADREIGEGAGLKLEEDYQAFRKGLSPEIRKSLEDQLYPAGRVHGHGMA